MVHNRHLDTCTWEAIECLPYKEEGTHFKTISRQVLFEGCGELPCQLRYFDIAPGGHSTLERHEHIHVIMVIKGSGKALVGQEIISLNHLDLLKIPKLYWHQLQACNNEPLGFLCLVHSDRDRPQRPGPEDIAQLQANPLIQAFIKI